MHTGKNEGQGMVVDMRGVRISTHSDRMKVSREDKSIRDGGGCSGDDTSEPIPTKRVNANPSYTTTHSSPMNGGLRHSREAGGCGRSGTQA